MGRLQSGLRDLESSVKNSVTKWEAETKLIKMNKDLALKKRLWVDFLVDPKLMAANVENIERKANAARLAKE